MELLIVLLLGAFALAMSGASRSRKPAPQAVTLAVCAFFAGGYLMLRVV